MEWTVSGALDAAEAAEMAAMSARDMRPETFFLMAESRASTCEREARGGGAWRGRVEGVLSCE